jgi:hypothetical protein
MATALEVFQIFGLARSVILRSLLVTNGHSVRQFRPGLLGPPELIDFKYLEIAGDLAGLRLIVGVVVDVPIEGVHPLLSDIEAELLFLGDVYERARSRDTAGEVAVVHISLQRSCWGVPQVWIPGSILVSRVLFALLLFPLIGKDVGILLSCGDRFRYALRDGAGGF